MSIYSVAPVQVCRVPGGYVDMTRGQSVIGDPPDEAESLSVPQVQICKVPGGYVDLTYGNEMARSVIGNPPKFVEWDYCLPKSISEYGGMYDLVEQMESGEVDIYVVGMGGQETQDINYYAFASSFDYENRSFGHIYAEGYEITGSSHYGLTVINDRGEYIGKINAMMGLRFYPSEADIYSFLRPPSAMAWVNPPESAVYDPALTKKIDVNVRYVPIEVAEYLEWLRISRQNRE